MKGLQPPTTIMTISMYSPTVEGQCPFQTGMSILHYYCSFAFHTDLICTVDAAWIWDAEVQIIVKSHAFNYNDQLQVQVVSRHEQPFPRFNAWKGYSRHKARWTALRSDMSNILPSRSGSMISITLQYLIIFSLHCLLGCVWEFIFE